MSDIVIIGGDHLYTNHMVAARNVGKSVGLVAARQVGKSDSLRELMEQEVSQTVLLREPRLTPTMGRVVQNMQYEALRAHFHNTRLSYDPKAHRSH